MNWPARVFKSDPTPAKSADGTVNISSTGQASVTVTSIVRSSKVQAQVAVAKRLEPVDQSEVEPIDSATIWIRYCYLPSP